MTLSERAAGFVREALRPSFAGSRDDLERVTAARVEAGLAFLVLGGRAIHLLQAGIDVSLGYRAYTHPVAAAVLALACAGESAVFARALLRRWRLGLAALLADAAFGGCGLAVLSYATAHTVGRTGSVFWMLPYTVTTAAGLGLLAGLHRGRAWLAGTAGCGVLAVGYAVGASSPGLVAGETPWQVVFNTANYPVFFGCAALGAIRLRRRLEAVAAGNERARREAAQLAAQAQWRAVVRDVFGPVLDVLDRAAEIGDEVPAELRAEAGRVVGLIEAANPRTGWAGG